MVQICICTETVEVVVGLRFFDEYAKNIPGRRVAIIPSPIMGTIFSIARFQISEALRINGAARTPITEVVSVTLRGFGFFVVSVFFRI